MYLLKYAAVSATGCLTGLLLSLALKGPLLENIRLYMGESESSSADLLLGIVGALLIFLLILAYVNGVLKRFRRYARRRPFGSV